MILDDKNLQNKFRTDVGRRMSKIRTARNMTQAKVGELLGCSEKHINEAERGKTMLNMFKMVDFCELMDCNMEYLVRGSNPLDRAFEIITDQITKIVISGNRQERDRLRQYMDNLREVVSPSDVKHESSKKS